MPHEDTASKKQGKRRKEAPFKRPVAWMPLDADPDNYHNLGGIFDVASANEAGTRAECCTSGAREV